MAALLLVSLVVVGSAVVDDVAASIEDVASPDVVPVIPIVAVV